MAGGLSNEWNIAYHTCDKRLTCSEQQVDDDYLAAAGAVHSNAQPALVSSGSSRSSTPSMPKPMECVNLFGN